MVAGGQLLTVCVALGVLSVAFPSCLHCEANFLLQKAKLFGLCQCQDVQEGYYIYFLVTEMDESKYLHQEMKTITC